jgi:hypothetical protein
MSKTKNTPEFLKMMEEQELSASFHYEETEGEYNSLREDLAKMQAIEKARIAFDIAAEALEIALDNYAKELTNLKNLLNEEE